MRARKPDKWLRVFEARQDALLRLFCFPYAGGGANIFRTWSAALPPTVEVCCVQFPGRETHLGVSPFRRMAALTDATTSALLPYLDKPFIFFGHSMGGLVSFEVVRKLRHQNINPLHLFISARSAPQIPDTEPPRHHLPEDEFLEELRHLDGTPKETLENQELMRLMLPTIRADFELCETYTYFEEPPLDCPIFVFRGNEDEEIPLNNLEAWSKQTSKAFVLRSLPGDHFFIHSAQSFLLQHLYKDIEEIINSRLRRSF